MFLNSRIARFSKMTSVIVFLVAGVLAQLALAQVPETDESKNKESANFLAEDDLAHYRTWRDKSMKFSVVAKMLGLKDGSVLLLKKDGKRVAVPLVKLSEDDRAYFRSVVNHLPKEPIEIEKQNGIEQATKTKIRGATRHQFEGYQIELPNRLIRQPVPVGSLPKGIRVAFWYSKTAEDVSDGTMVFQIIDKAVIDKGKKESMRQTLVNISAGFTDSQGIKISKWGGSEIIETSNIQLTRLPWIANAQSDPIVGVSYGGWNNGDFLFVIFIPVDEDRVNTVQAIDKFVRTLQQM